MDNLGKAVRFNVAAPRILIAQNKNKLRGVRPQANYTDRATAACRRS
jgi:hypothetical protein